MILVEIQVPALDEAYDFELKEEETTGELITDIQALICEQEQIICADGGELQLYSLRQEGLLEKHKSLKQQGVRAGDELVLF